MTLELRHSIEAEILSKFSALLPEGYKLNVSISQKEKPDYNRTNAEIIRAEVCNYFDKSIDDLFKKCRKTDLVLTKKFLCYYLKNNTTYSTTIIAEIAGFTGKVSNHANTLHAINTLNDWLDTDDEIRNHRNNLNKIILSKIQL
jgi:chromosomal replication initiation ATPase DnaA